LAIPNGILAVDYVNGFTNERMINAEAMTNGSENNSSTPALPVRLRLSDGSIHLFTQENATINEKLWKGIEPSRLFAKHRVVIGSQHSKSVFVTSEIVRVDFLHEKHLPQRKIDYECNENVPKEGTMNKGYWVVAYRSISDESALKAYAALALPAVQSFGGRFLTSSKSQSIRLAPTFSPWITHCVTPRHAAGGFEPHCNLTVTRYTHARNQKQKKGKK